MRDVVDAYQILLSNQGVKGAARDGTVSANVEKFTIRELMNDEEVRHAYFFFFFFFF
jgi:hypothetical protein